MLGDYCKIVCPRATVEEDTKSGTIRGNQEGNDAGAQEEGECARLFLFIIGGI